MSYLNGGLIMLKEMLPNLPQSEKKIAQYMIDQPEKAINLTASQLGKGSGTSSAAVIRLCKSLGLKGLQELKLRIAGDIQKNDHEGYIDIEPNETVSSVIHKMTNNSIQSIKETAELLNNQHVKTAIHLLKNARRIHFVGVGASSIIAQDAQQKFSRIDKDAYAFSDMHLAATLVANASDDDVVVGISFSGETKEVAKIIELAKNKGIKTVSLTKYGNSTVAQHASINLYTSASYEPTFRSGATSSRMAQLQVIDIMFMGVASSLYDHTLQSLDATREAVQFLSEKK